MKDISRYGASVDEGPMKASVSLDKTCAFCEYFDGGGELKVNEARNGNRIHGDCLNSWSSPYCTVYSNQTCDGFFPDSSNVTGELQGAL